MWDNYHSGYSKSEARGRSIIDGGVALGVIIFGISNPVEWTVAAGIGAGLVAELHKNNKYRKE